MYLDADEPREPSITKFFTYPDPFLDIDGGGGVDSKLAFVSVGCLALNNIMSMKPYKPATFFILDHASIATETLPSHSIATLST